MTAWAQNNENDYCPNNAFAGLETGIYGPQNVIYNSLVFPPDLQFVDSGQITGVTVSGGTVVLIFVNQAFGNVLCQSPGNISFNVQYAMQ